MTEPNEAKTFINDRYLVKEKLGKGGMGRILLVEDSWNGYQPQALKKMRKDKLNKNEVTNLRREFLSVSHLSHPNLAKAYSFGYDWINKDYFFTSEYVDGVHLDIGLKDADLDRILEGFVQSCRGLEFIHNHGMVHGDIKPENMLYQADSVSLHDNENSNKGQAFRIKLIDFGLTVKEKGFASKKIVGTAYYVAPEAILGAMSDRRTDLYSLGIVFYLICTGTLPFKGKTNVEILKRHLETTPRSPHDLNRDIPLGLSNLIMRLIAKKPAKRPSSAVEVIQLLSEVSGRSFPLETPQTSNAYLYSQPLTGRGESFQAIRSVTHQALNLENHSLASNDILPAVKDRIALPEECRLLLVEGEQGLGKSRLLWELKVSSETRGALVIETSDGDLISSLHKKLKTAEDPESIIATIEALSEKQPILLLCNRMENCTQKSDAFLRTLIQHKKKSPKQKAIFCCLGATPTNRSSAFVELMLLEVIQEKMAHLKLLPLKKNDIRLLIDHTFPENSFSVSFVDQLVFESEGNPGATLSILKALLDNEAILRTRKSWKTTFTSLSDVALPSGTGRKHLEEQITTLSEEALETAKTLSILKNNFPLETVGELASATNKNILSTLTELKQKGILISEKNSFSFASKSLQNILYTGLDETAKKKYHEKAAVVLSRIKAPAETLFFHYFHAEIEAKALETGLEAVASFYKAGRYENALEILQILNSFSSWPKYSSYALLRAELLLTLSYNMEAETLLTALLKSNQFNDADNAKILALLGKVKIKTGYINEGAKLIQEGIQTAKRSGKSEIIAQLLYLAAVLFHTKGQYTESIHAAAKALHACGTLELKQLKWKILLLHGENYYSIGKTKEALVATSRALEILDQKNHVTDMAASLRCLAGFWRYRDYPGKSILQLTIGRSVHNRLGLKDKEAEDLTLLGELQLARGETILSRQNLRRALKITHDTGNRLLLPRIHLLTAESAWQMGYYEEAKAQTANSCTMSEEVQNAPYLSRSHFILSLIYCDQGKMSQAEEQHLAGLRQCKYAELIKVSRMTQAYIASYKGRWEAVFNLLKKEFGEGKRFHPVFSVLYAVACTFLDRPAELEQLSKGLFVTGNREDLSIIKALLKFISGLTDFINPISYREVEHFKQALKRARTSKSDRLITWICLFLGHSLINEHEYDQAYLVLEEGLFLSKRLNLILLKGYLWQEMGLLETQMPGGKLQRSLSYLNSAEKVGGKYHLQEILACSRIKKAKVLSQYGQFEQAEKTLKSGSYYLKKVLKEYKTPPGKNTELTRMNQLVEELQQKLSKIKVSRKTKKTFPGFFGLLGNSPAMQKVYQQIAACSKDKQWIWISGPNGTGKTKTARTIHTFCKRLENEIAFCDSLTFQNGGVDAFLEELAEKRIQTLILEEVSNLPEAVQLRLHESAPETLQHIIATTSYDLNELFETEVLAKKLLPDEKHRIYLPSLHARRKDIDILFYHYLTDKRPEERKEPLTIDQDAKAFLQEYTWPRNLTELVEFCSNAYTFAGSATSLSKEMVQMLVNPTKTVPQKTPEKTV